MDPWDKEPTYYNYSPLPPQHIRLLKLKPRISSDNGPIEVELLIVPLESAPKYDALSYTWGEPTRFLERTAEREIFTRVSRCYPIFTKQNKIILGTRNLRNALANLRLLEGADGPELYFDSTGWEKSPYLWIDAICINQEDVLERNSQVALMGEIYKGASAVTAWLGQSDDHSKIALPAIEALAHLPLEKARKIAQMQINLLTNAAYHSQSLGIKPISSEGWIHITLFLTRRWFSRAWVRQEIILAKRIAIVSGTMLIGWAALASCVEFISHANWVLAITGIMRAARDSKTPLGLICDSDNIQEWDGRYEFLRTAAARLLTLKGNLLPFIEIIHICQYTQASEPVDKIFALLSIAKELCSEAKTRLRPDYTETAAIIYTRATRIVLESSRGLQSLSYRQVKKFRNILDLPIWCPDYSQLLAPNILRAVNYDPLKQWNPSTRRTHISTQQNLADYNLLLQGALIDTVEGATGDLFSMLLWDGVKSGIDLFDFALELFRTSNGRIGIGHEDVLPGDQIWAVAGAGVLFMLRPRPDGHYEFVGDAFVYGVMDGEAISDDTEWQDITVV